MSFKELKYLTSCPQLTSKFLVACTCTHHAMLLLIGLALFMPTVFLFSMRFTRVVFVVSATLFLLNATINHHLEKYQSHLITIPS